jgi:putative DNA primase/helicase
VSANHGRRLADVRVRDVLAAIFDGCSGVLELRAKSAAAIVRTAFVPPADTDAIRAFAQTHHQDDVWFGVATRRDGTSGALANCDQLGALYVDLDCDADARQLADADARLAEFAIPPSIVVASGGGRHPYWLLREPADVQAEAATLRTILRQLALALGGDLASAEPARVLRLPGSLNQKYDAPRPVTITVFEPSLRYNPSDFELLPNEPVSVAGSPSDALDLSAISAGERNRTLYRLGRSLRAKGLPTAAISQALRATNATCRPPLDGRELEALIRQATTQPDRGDFVPAVAVESDTLTTGTRRAVVTRLADIEPQTIQYVWPGRLARGRLNLLIGDPGLGKSFVALDIAARVSRGLDWPDGGVAPVGDVLVLSAEDNAADTIRPRADALGADVARIHVLSAVHTEGTATDQDRPFSLVTDLPQLEAGIVATGAIVAVVDPVSAYLGMTVDSYKDAHVRAVLGPLAALAERQHIAVLGVMHLSKAGDKRAIYRALGSVAFVAAARLVFAVAEHPEDKEQRVLVPVKTNICAPAPILAYMLTDGNLSWSREPPPNLTADELLAAKAFGRHPRQDAVEWLRQVLASGQVKVKVLEQEAKGAGYAWRTVERAKAQAGVDTVRIGGIGSEGEWYWMLRSKTAKLLRLIPKSAMSAQLAALDADMTNASDLSGSDAKSARSGTTADLGDATGFVPAGASTAARPPAWVTQDAPPLAADDADGPFADRDDEDDNDERL